MKNADQLAADLAGCTRTVRRYLDEMSRAGVPIPPLFAEYQPRPNG